MFLDYTFIGKRVSSKRKELNLTQIQLAEKTNLTPKYISNIENSHSIPSIQSIMQLCKALDIKPTQMLFGIDDDTDNPKIKAINNRLITCTPEQLDKVLDYVELLTNR